MLISYMRSSSYNNWDFCQMQYFLNYVLGIPQKTGKRAQQGTIVHKVLEVLANCKKVMQECTTSLDDDTYKFDDEHIGMIHWDGPSFLKPTLLQPDEVDKINKTRINKYNYNSSAKIPYNTVHYGQNMVDGIFVRAYDHYKWDDWTPADRLTCYNWTWMALEYKNGIFDPRKRNIVAAEPRFDLKISEKLGIKGTIDLITSLSEGIIEVIDYKTGARKNWGSKKSNDIKTYDKLCKDFQLMLYYYAVKHMYPEAQQVMVTIYYIRDGGPYTICFDDNTIIETEQKLQERFQEISSCNFPAMRNVNQTDFQCTKLCDYYKMTAPYEANMCKFIHSELVEHGIEYVTDVHTRPGFSVGHYQEPGQ